MSLFERLEKERPIEEAVAQPGRLPTPSEKLQSWLIDHWAKPTITAREIYTYGPLCARGKEKALRLAQILVEQGWLVPREARQRDTSHLFLPDRGRQAWREWKIVRSQPDSPTA